MARPQAGVPTLGALYSKSPRNPCVVVIVAVVFAGFLMRVNSIPLVGGWPTFTFFVKVGTHAAGVASFILASLH